METLADIALPQARGRQLDVATAHAARLFRERIEDGFRPSKLLVFGSRARGTQDADSDADIAVVLDDDDGDRWSIARAMARTAFDVLVETGILIDPVPVWEGGTGRARSVRQSGANSGDPAGRHPFMSPPAYLGDPPPKEATSQALR